MKKLKYLIPLFVLASCATSVEVYDDVYTKVKTVEADPINEDLGYADYIKGSESEYFVQIDSTDQGANQMGEGYYTNSGDIIVNNYSSPNPNGFGPSSNFYYNNWGPNYFNNPYGNWGGYYGGWNNYNGWNNYYGWNNGFYAGWGNNYWNNGFYGNPYWGCNNGYYGNPYWGNNNYWNGYNNGYWNGYNNGFNNGWNNNSWSNNGSGIGAGSGGSNHIYGHRGSVSSNSPNTTAYDHTVKASVQGGGATSGSAIVKPFEVYSNEIADVTAGLGIGQKVNGENGASYLTGSVSGASGSAPAEQSRLNGVSNNVSNAGGAAVYSGASNGSSTVYNSGGIINGNVKEPVKASNTAVFSGGAATNGNVNGGTANTAGVAASNQNAFTTSSTATNKFASTSGTRPSNVAKTVGGGTKYSSSNAGTTNPSQANTTDRSRGTSRTVTTGSSSTTSGSNRTTTTTTNTNTRTNTGGSTYGNRTTSSGSSSGSSSGGSSRSGSSGGGGSSSGGSSRR